MFRPALSRPSQFKTRILRRHFHATSQRRLGIDWQAKVDLASDKAYVFHDLFQHVHTFTGLPWLVSIPLVTFLTRGALTPARLYFARQRQHQYLALPKLRFGANMIEKQGDMRLAKRVESKEENIIWRRKQWESYVNTIKKNDPLAEPTILSSTNSKFDITNIAAMSLVFINTSTLLSLSTTGLFDLQLASVEEWRVLLSYSFAILAASNTVYCHNNILLDSSRTPSTIWDASSQLMEFLLVLLPFLIVKGVLCSPDAVVLYIVSNSLYTFMERKVVDRVFELPKNRHQQLKLAMQSTR